VDVRKSDLQEVEAEPVRPMDELRQRS
jgi:hypothetical protein